MIDETRENFNIEEVAVKVNDIFDRLPLTYKHYAFKRDTLLVLGDLKAATDATFLGDTYNEADFEIFQKVFGDHGIKLSSFRIDSLNDGTPLRIAYMYNPRVLKEQTAKSSYAPPYNGEMDIKEYIAMATQKGYPIGGVLGKIYSFPESAISDYVGKNTLRKGERISLHNGESYWTYKPYGPDVSKRESAKKKFFDGLGRSKLFIHAYNHENHGLSMQAWERRLPPSIKQ